MPIFMKKCESCNSERQVPKLDTITCPDCGAERDFLRAQTTPPAEWSRNNVEAQAQTPDLEALRKKYLGSGERRNVTPKITKGEDKFIFVEHPGLGPKVVIIDSEGTVIGAQG